MTRRLARVERQPAVTGCGSCIRWRRLMKPGSQFGRCVLPAARQPWWAGLSYPMLDGSTFTPPASPLLREGHGGGCGPFKARRG